MSFPSSENSLTDTIQDLKAALNRAQADSHEVGEALEQLEKIMVRIENKAIKLGFVPAAIAAVAVV